MFIFAKQPLNLFKQQRNQSLRASSGKYSVFVQSSDIKRHKIIMKIITAVAWCAISGKAVSPLLAPTALVPTRTYYGTSFSTTRSQNASSRLFAGYGKVSTSVDPYAGLLNKVDGSGGQAFVVESVKEITENVPGVLEELPGKAGDSSMKVLEDVSTSITDAAAYSSDAGSAASWFGRTTEGSGTAQQTFDEVSKAASEASAAATAAAQSMAASFDGTIKSAVSRSVPGMKAKAGGELAAGTAPTLTQFLSGQRQAAGESLSGNNFMEKLSIMKNNLMNMELTAGFDPDAVARGDPGTIANTFNVNNLMDLFRVREYGAWYLVVVAVLIAIGQKNVGEEEARRILEQDLKLAEEKAAAATEAAAKAAEEAKKAKKIATKSQESKTDLDVDAAKLKTVMAEQESLKKELEAAKAEAQKLREELQSVLSTKASSSVPQSGVTTKEATVVNGITEPAKQPSSKRVAKKSPAKKKTTATATELVAEAAKPKSSTATVEKKKESAPPKKSKATGAKEKSTDETEKWAKLSESSLKRKTVAELSGFLESQGVKSTAENGKPLMKKDLLAKVKELV